MYKSFITSQHDLITQKKLDQIINHIKEITKLTKSKGFDDESGWSVALTQIINRLSSSDWNTHIEILDKLDNTLKNVSKLQPSKNLSMDDRVSLEASTFGPINKLISATIPIIEELQYLISIKLKDTDLSTINESILIAQQNLTAINNSIFQITGDNNILAEAIKKEQGKAEEANKQFVQFIESNTQTTKELIGLVSADKVTKEYQKKSEEEKTLADKYRKHSTIALLTASSLVLVTLILVLGSAVLSALPANHTWGINFKAVGIPTSVLFLAFSLLIPAAFFARESHKHRTLEILNLKTSQNLKSFLPFIEALPDPEKTMVKTYLAINIFSKEKDSADGDTPPVFIQDLLLKLAEKKLPE